MEPLRGIAPLRQILHVRSGLRLRGIRRNYFLMKAETRDLILTPPSLKLRRDEHGRAPPAGRLEPMRGIEPRTPSLPWTCSTS